MHFLLSFIYFIIIITPLAPNFDFFCSLFESPMTKCNCQLSKESWDYKRVRWQQSSQISSQRLDRTVLTMKLYAVLVLVAVLSVGKANFNSCLIRLLKARLHLWDYYKNDLNIYRRKCYEWLNALGVWGAYKPLSPLRYKLIMWKCLFTASGLKCYVCSTRDNCQKVDCPAGSDRCSSTMVEGKMVVAHQHGRQQAFQPGIHMFLYWIFTVLPLRSPDQELLCQCCL